MKLCCKCGDEPRLAYHSYCRGCRNAYMRANRPRYYELSARDRLRSICRAYTNVLIRRGVLKRGPCVDCGSTDVEAHHTDYSKPRVVTWLCALCRRARHHAAA